MVQTQGRSQTFSFGGATGGVNFATRGAVNGLCRTFRKRPTPVARRHAENFGGATGRAKQNLGGEVPPPGTPLAPPLSRHDKETLRTTCIKDVKFKIIKKDRLSVCRILLLQRKPYGPHETFVCWVAGWT